MTDKHDDACGSQACQSPTVESRATGGVAFRIANMDCPTEEAEIRRAVEALEGVRGLRFDLSARVLRLDADPLALQAALAAIRKAGFDPQPLVEADSTAGRDAFAEGLPRLLIGLLVFLFLLTSLLLADRGDEPLRQFDALASIGVARVERPGIAESTLGHGLSKVMIGCRDDPHIRQPGARAA